MQKLLLSKILSYKIKYSSFGFVNFKIVSNTVCHVSTIFGNLHYLMHVRKNKSELMTLLFKVPKFQSFMKHLTKRSLLWNFKFLFEKIWFRFTCILLSNYIWCSYFNKNTINIGPYLSTVMCFCFLLIFLYIINFSFLLISFFPKIFSFLSF